MTIEVTTKLKIDKLGLLQPAEGSIKSWAFNQDEEDEAVLAVALAKVGEKNGLTVNDLQHIFPCVLRMLKSDSSWSGVS